MPYIHLNIYCKMDTAYFPFDYQQCPIRVTAWASTAKLLSINLLNPAIIIPLYNDSGEVFNSQWTVTSVDARRKSLTYEHVAEPYSGVEFIITVRRRPLYHLIHVIFPMLLLHCLSLVPFFVPPEGGERMSVGVTTFLSFSLFSLIITEQSPESSTSLPIACE